VLLNEKSSFPPLPGRRPPNPIDRLKAVARSYEQLAAQILEQVLRGQVKRRDVPGAVPNTHDLDLHLPNGDIVAVEVTQVTNEEERALWSPKHKRTWLATRLCESWALDIDPAKYRHKDRSDLEGILKELERLGVKAFGLRRPVPARANALIDQLESLGVKSGHAFSHARPFITISTSNVGMTHPEIISSIVEDVAWKDDNREKLGNAKGFKERHLFIWIDELAHQASVAMDNICDNLGMPRPVGLPFEVDVVWVAKQHVSPASRVCLWQYRKGGGWQRVR
jgi:hypothetical protein